MSCHGSRDDELQESRKANENEEKPWEIVEELKNDSRIGKRAFCLSLLPDIVTYGTIQEIIRYSNKNERPSRAMEYWYVLTDPGIRIEAPSQSFELYEYETEFQAGDHVRKNVDEVGYWEGVILRPILTFDHLRFVVRVENVQTTRAERGDEAAYPPGRLIKL